jgi:hypothetical protein
MVRIRRINFFAGPGAAKSTLAAWLFAQLKIEGFDAEHVSEAVKFWTFIGRPPTSFDQVYLMAKQLHQEDIILRGSKAIVVTESPLLLSVCYAMRYGAPCWDHLARIGREFDKKYPPLNLFVDRGDLEYKTDGRFEDRENAIKMDKMILGFLRKNDMPYSVKRFDERDEILAVAKNAITGGPWPKGRKAHG